MIVCCSRCSASIALACCPTDLPRCAHCSLARPGRLAGELCWLLLLAGLLIWSSVSFPPTSALFPDVLPSLASNLCPTVSRCVLARPCCCLRVHDNAGAGVAIVKVAAVGACCLGLLVVTCLPVLAVVPCLCCVESHTVFWCCVSVVFVLSLLDREACCLRS